MKLKKLNIFCLLFISLHLNAKNISNDLINADIDSTFFQKCMNKSSQKNYEKCNDLNNKQFPMITAENKKFNILKQKVDILDNRIGSKPSSIPITTISASNNIFDSNTQGGKYIITYHLLNDEHNVKEKYIFYNLNSNSQRIDLGSNFRILNNGQVIMKNKQKLILNSKGLYELKK